MTDQNSPQINALNLKLPEIDLRFDGSFFTSNTHDDIYFSKDGGLDESVYVFCEGTELAALMMQKKAITIAETGFGTGLNLMAVLALRDEIGADCQIDFVSFEACPLDADIMEMAHRPFPRIERYSHLLRDKLPPRWHGYHKVDLEPARTHLHLYYGDGFAHISKLQFKADIWFLDGFNPRKNTDLWHEDMMQEIARCSHEGARLATFTVAAMVRQGLEKAGFILQKRAGFGRKRDMLTATKAGTLPARQEIKTPVIIGGGIAGASLAFALINRGIKPVILEQKKTLAMGASGNPVAMQSARLRVHHDAPSRLSVSCLSYAKALAENAGVVLHDGSLMINKDEKESLRHEKLLSLGWPEELCRYLDKEQVHALTSLPASYSAVSQSASSIINPQLFTKHLASEADVRTDITIAAIDQGEGGYNIKLEGGDIIEADHLFLACGSYMSEILSLCSDVVFPVEVSAGQISIYEAPYHLAAIQTGLHYGGYMTPPIDGRQYWGASFDKTGQIDVTLEGHHHNQSLLPQLWHEADLPDIHKAKGRLSYRLSTKDRQPLIGSLNPYLHIMTALGARGMTTAPLSAQMLIARLCGAPEGFDMEVVASLSPQRFLR